MDNIIIRRMTVDDADAVHRIEKATFARPWRREDFVKEVTQNVCARYLVAVMDDAVIGFAGAWIILDESHITNIAVSEAYRGRGVGRLLASAIMQYASDLGASVMTLEVRQSNLVAQSLYKSLGFRQASVRKKYYEDNGEDALLMVCAAMPPADEDFCEPETVTE